MRKFFNLLSGRRRGRKRKKDRQLNVEPLECRLLLAGDSWSAPDFDYVGSWRQYHKDSQKIGLGTAELIHPRWVITAYHVAQFKAKNPNGGATEIRFKGSRYSRYVDRVYKAPGVDIALAKLKTPLFAVEPVSLLKQPFKANDGVIDFTIAGRSGGLHYKRVRGESRLGGKSFRVIGDGGGKAGDSGGFWGIERYGNLPDVQFAVLHGGGVAPQVGPISDWIDRIIGPGKVNWVTKSELRNGIRTDTHTWTGNGRYTTWTNQGNWDSGGNPGVSGSLVASNHQTARLRWMGAKSKIHAVPRVENHWSLGRLEILASKDHNLTVANSKNWNATTGGGRKTILLNGADGQVFDVTSDPNGSFTYAFAPGIRILVNEDLFWDVHGDETLRINGRVNGTGTIIKRGNGTLIFGNTGDQVTNNGSNGLDLRSGNVILAKRAGSSAIRGDVIIGGNKTVLELNQDEQIENEALVTTQSGLFDLNGYSETIGTLVLAGGAVQGGTLRADSGGFQVHSGSISADLAGGGNLAKSTNGEVILEGNNSYSGITTVSHGKLRINGRITSDVTVGGGWLEGRGTVVGNVDVRNSGGISAGNSPGTLSLDGDLLVSGTMLVEIGGTLRGTDYDLLDVSGGVTVAGMLAVDLLDGFVPSFGDEFTIISATGGVNGTFESEDLPALPAGLKWDIHYNSHNVTLQVVSSAAGRVDLTLVTEPTMVDAITGKVDALPQSVEWLDEWAGFFAEIWASNSGPDTRRIEGATLKLSYNTDYFTATTIKYGPAFGGRTLPVTDTADPVSVAAAAPVAVAGDGGPTLLARVEFASTPDDRGVSLAPGNGYSSAAEDFTWVVQDARVLLTGGGASVPDVGPPPGTELWPVIYDLNDDHIVDFSDLAYFAGAFQHSVGDGAYSWVADFDGSGHTDFTDLAYLAGNFQRSNTAPAPVVFPGNFPHAWRGHPLRLDEQPSARSSTAVLTSEQLAPLVNEAVARIKQEEDEQAVAPIAEVTFEIVDLPGDVLGRAHGGSVVQIDVNAAGYGWFVDPTPWNDGEFAPRNGAHALTTLPSSSASNHPDLLTVVLHELGHVLGYGHSDAGGVMDESLPLDTRRLWADGTILEEPAGLRDLLVAPGLTPAVVDDYFAAT